jgi:2',3'-cyclic-nucleotide 2'-phosphodiesterase (5'-nucleotidase family)
VADLSFQEPASVVPDLVRRVRGEGAGLVIVLSHLGLDADEDLARRVSGIDVIVGGHSHTVVTSPLRINGTIIVQAGYYGLYVGALEMEVDSGTQRIVRYNTRDALRPVVVEDQARPDATIAAIANRYENEIRAEFTRVVGKSDVDLVRRPFAESNVGNLIADAMIDASGADMAFQNGGGIRADLASGDITLEGLYTLLPFDNQLVSMTLRGDQVLQLLEASGDQHVRVLQVSGIRVEYDMNRPAGSRVVQASVKGEPLRPDAAYRVVTNDFLAAGGDKFTTFREGTSFTFGDTLRDAVSDYLRKHSPVKPAVEERILFRD